METYFDTGMRGIIPMTVPANEAPASFLTANKIKSENKKDEATSEFYFSKYLLSLIHSFVPDDDAM